LSASGGSLGPSDSPRLHEAWASLAPASDNAQAVARGGRVGGSLSHAASCSSWCEAVGKVTERIAEFHDPINSIRVMTLQPYFFITSANALSSVTKVNLFFKAVSPIRAS
jgi:hypothetical protein